MIIEWQQPTGDLSVPAPQPAPLQLEIRKRRARHLCMFAANRTSWALADKLAKAWGCVGCLELGIEEPE